MKTYEIKVPGYKINEQVYYVEPEKSSKIQNKEPYKYAARLMQEHSLKSVIDVGCGLAAKLVTYIVPVAKRVVGVDTNETISILKNKYPKVCWKVADFEKFTNPVAENFDLLICVDVIEHMEDPDKLLDFIKRQTTESTTVLITTPDRFNWEPNGPPPNKRHVREWTLSEFKNYLKKSGFKVNKAFHVSNLERITIVAVCKVKSDGEV